MRPRLVALDLDGTLLTTDCRLPMGHALAVQALRRMGVTVAIATGRPLLTTRWVQRDLGLDGPLVCFNGGWVGQPDRTPIAAHGLAESEVHEVIAVLAGGSGAICCYPDADTWIMDREIAHTRYWRDIYQAPIAIHDDLRSAWRGPSLKMMYVVEPEHLPATQQRLAERFGERFHVVASQDDRLEIMPRCITKAWGLRHLAEHLGIAREDVWAVGDAENDREMVQWAGHGCMMGQASDRLRSLARHILPGIEARGLCALPGLIARHLADD